MAWPTLTSIHALPPVTWQSLFRRMPCVCVYVCLYFSVFFFFSDCAGIPNTHTIKFTTFTIFKPHYRWVALSTFTLLWTQPHHPSPEHFSSSETMTMTMSPLNRNSPSPTILLPVSKNLTPLGTSHEWSHKAFVLVFWLLPLCIMSSRFVQGSPVVAGVRMSILFQVE